MNKKSKVMNIAIAFLLVAVLLATCFAGYTLAKYIIEGVFSDKAQGAQWGTIELREHKYDEKNEKFDDSTEYKLQNITYDELSSGIIHKDPFIVLSGTFEVSFALFVKLVETNVPLDSDGNPEITFEFDYKDEDKKPDEVGKGDIWVLKHNDESMSNGNRIRTRIYRYIISLPAAGSIIEEGEELKIYLLKDNQMVVANTFDNRTDTDKFSYKFSAWIEQINGTELPGWPGSNR